MAEQEGDSAVLNGWRYLRQALPVGNPHLRGPIPSTSPAEDPQRWEQGPHWEYLLSEGQAIPLLAAPAKAGRDSNQIPSIRGDSRARITHLTCPTLPSPGIALGSPSTPGCYWGRVQSWASGRFLRQKRYVMLKQQGSCDAHHLPPRRAPVKTPDTGCRGSCFLLATAPRHHLGPQPGPRGAQTLALSSAARQASPGHVFSRNVAGQLRRLKLRGDRRGKPLSLGSFLTASATPPRQTQLR